MLGSYNLEDLATLKASSAFDESWYHFIKEQQAYVRKKAIEAVRPLIVDPSATPAINLLKGSLQKVEQQGGMHICIFKKSQYGGLREIYVLGIHERVVQLSLECIARCICKMHLQDVSLRNNDQREIQVSQKCNAFTPSKGNFWRVLHHHSQSN